MTKNKIVIISTPYSKESEYVKQLKIFFKDLEIKEIKLDGKLRGYSPKFIEIDSMTCNSSINCKQKREDATLKIAGTN